MEKDRPSVIPGLVQEVTEKSAQAQISGFWRRLLALVIDGITLGAIGFVFGICLFDFLAELGAWGRLVGFAIALTYFGMLNSSIGQGQTIGKRLTRIKVTDVSGQTISPAKSFLRYIFLGTPFFLNGAMIPISIVMSPIGSIIGLIIFGVGGAIIYLYIFNRKTRQSLHDLLVHTYVIRSSTSGPIERQKVWKGHIVVVGVWVLLVLIFITLVSPKLSQRWRFPEILSVLEDIQNSGKVHTASVFEGKSWGSFGETSYFRANAVWKKKPKDFDKATEEIAEIVLKEYPHIMDRDLLVVTVTYGYDIGIARAWRSRNVRHSPEQWKQRLSQSYNAGEQVGHQPDNSLE